MVQLPILIEVVRVDPTGRHVVAKTELAAGRYTVGRSRDCSVVVEGEMVSRIHLILDVSADAIVVEDNGSTHGTLIGGEMVERASWDTARPIQLPGFEIVYAGSGVQQASAPAPLDSVQFSKIIGQEDRGRRNDGRAFPFDVFDGPVVSTSKILSSGYYSGECEYLALGGGNGSFAWVDHLRVYGVSSSAIRVIGVTPECYANWARYCMNSQIPPHERIRSNSISTPDNLWGYPGYAGRETWRELKKGNIGGLKYVFQVFGEPATAQTYTPRLRDVYTSLDKEMERIGWKNMFMFGRIITLRKTDDGRYAIAYRVPADKSRGERRDNIIIAKTIHIATGYPATRFTDDLQRFKADNQPVAHLAVNAYDPHDQIYFEIEQSKKPETIVVRGRGIVASRVIQRLSEARNRNPNIQIVHQMRSRIPDGKGFVNGWAKRKVFSDVEIQAFNWPKSSWGGELLRELERHGPEGRSRLIQNMAGTSTPRRDDWRDIINIGGRDGWYKKVFGNLKSMAPAGTPDDLKVRMEVVGSDGGHAEVIVADYVVDCTGLIGDVKQSPFLSDLVSTYQLNLNPIYGPPGKIVRYSGISVSNNFEIEGLRNGDGRAYGAGTITGNGPHAAVDSFLGLQYAALRSVDHLGIVGAPGVSKMGPLESFGQWLKWCRGASPDRR